MYFLCAQIKNDRPERMYADTSRADVGSKHWKLETLPLRKPEMWMKCLRADKAKHQPTLADGG
jgi:hypothetical protein